MDRRKSARTSAIDYTNGTFFVTMCAENMSCIFGRVSYGEDSASVDLSKTGRRVEEAIHFIDGSSDSIVIEKFVVMPNHVHILLTIKDGELSKIVGRIKSYVQYYSDQKIWQRSYYDHKVRNEDDFKNHWLYIENNPAKWAYDKYYSNT